MPAIFGQWLDFKEKQEKNISRKNIKGKKQ